MVLDKAMLVDYKRSSLKMKTLLLCPTYNRVETTLRFVDFLRSQKVAQPLELIVVDASSPDGTADEIARASCGGALQSIRVVSVSRRHLWAQAMNVAMSEAARCVSERDAVIFINDDVHPEEDAIAVLLDDHLDNDRAIVTARRSPGSAVERLRIERGHFGLLDVAPSASDDEVIPISAAPGRFTVIPASIILNGHRLHHRLFPHHFADLDFTSRMREQGTKCLLSTRAIFSDVAPPSSTILGKSVIHRLFSRKSPDRLLSGLFFWGRHAGMSAVCSRLLSPKVRYRRTEKKS